jgi:hypothetical protein
MIAMFEFAFFLEKVFLFRETSSFQFFPLEIFGDEPFGIIKSSIEGNVANSLSASQPQHSLSFLGHDQF